MNVESWCKVEAGANPKVKRPNRKHFPQFNKTTTSIPKIVTPERMEEKPKLEIGEVTKKKHFPEKRISSKMDYYIK